MAFFSPADGWSTSQLRQWTCSSDLTCVTHLSSHVFTSVQAVLLSLNRETVGPFKHKKYIVIFLVAVSLKNCSWYCQNMRLCIWPSLTEIVFSQRYSWANSRTLLKTSVIQAFTNDVFSNPLILEMSEVRFENPPIYLFLKQKSSEITIRNHHDSTWLNGIPKGLPPSPPSPSPSSRLAPPRGRSSQPPVASPGVVKLELCQLTKNATPLKINSLNLKMIIWKMIFLFQWCSLWFHVNLLGCTL